MINSVRRLFLGGLLMSLICSCGKDNDPGADLPPVADHPLTGLLCTIGKTSSFDTLVYSHMGTGQVIGYLNWVDFGEDKVTLTPQGNGTWAVKRINPRTNPLGDQFIYFGCYPINVTIGTKPNSGEFTDNFTYKHTLRESVTPDSEFILTRDDKDPRLFYLESKLYPGNYLTAGPRRWDNTLDENYLLYSEIRRAFFIIPD